MLVKTLLNQVYPNRGFVYERVHFWEGEGSSRTGQRLEVEVRSRRGSRGRCSGCGDRGPGYDRLEPRRFDFVPLWGIPVVFVYAMRRIACRRCGVKVEQVPWLWAGSKGPATIPMQCFLARWARRLSWREVAEAFHVSWEQVFRSVAAVVSYGLARRDLSDVEAVGVDEVAYAKGHRYATLVYQLNGTSRRLLYVAEARTAKSLLGFFRMLKKAGIDARQQIGHVCSDMWRPYRKVLAKKVPEAVHILDRYHIVANLNKALDEVRAKEAKELKAEGWEILKSTKWLLLRRRKKLSGKQEHRLRDVVQWNLRTVRAYLLKEELNPLWEYKSPTHAGRYLDAWCRRVMRSKLEPLKKVARSLRSHRELILNWFRAKKQYNAGIVEGLNLNVKLRFRKAYGFKTFTAVQTALYHQLGRLPEPPLPHRFC